MAAPRFDGAVVFFVVGFAVALPLARTFLGSFAVGAFFVVVVVVVAALDVDAFALVGAAVDLVAVFFAGAALFVFTAFLASSLGFFVVTGFVF